MYRQPTADRLTAVLTFALLAGGTAAFGSALLGLDRPAAPAAVSHATVQLPTVEVTGHRATEVATVRLPAVEVTGKRDAPLTALVAKTAPVVSLPAVTVTGRRAEPLVTAASGQSLRVGTSASEGDCANAPAAGAAGQDA